MPQYLLDFGAFLFCRAINPSYTRGKEAQRKWSIPSKDVPETGSIGTTQILDQHHSYRTALPTITVDMLLCSLIMIYIIPGYQKLFLCFVNKGRKTDSHLKCCLTLKAMLKTKTLVTSSNGLTDIFPTASSVKKKIFLFAAVASTVFKSPCSAITQSVL